VSWANQYPAMWAEIMQDGDCWQCGGPGPHARIWFLAGERAVWGSACHAHRTELELTA
jgi:hypothetical protein